MFSLNKYTYTERQDKLEQVKNTLNKALSFNNNTIKVFTKMNGTYRVVSENINLNRLFDHYGFKYAVTRHNNKYYYSLSL